MSDEPQFLIGGVDFGEGPRWHAGRLWYSDFYQRAVYSVSAAGDRRVEHGGFDDQPSGLGWMPDGRTLFVLCAPSSQPDSVAGKGGGAIYTLAAPHPHAGRP